MGYCGLEDSGASDLASGFLYSVGDKIAKMLKKESKEDNGCFNTNGSVNAAFFVSEVLRPAAANALENDVASSFFNEDLLDALKQVKKKLQEEIDEADETTVEEWGDEPNRLMHYNRFVVVDGRC